MCLRENLTIRRIFAILLTLALALALLPELAIPARAEGAREITIDMYCAPDEHRQETDWNGNALRVEVNNIAADVITVADVKSSYKFSVDQDDEVALFWSSGGDATMCAYVMYYSDAPLDEPFTPAPEGHTDCGVNVLSCCHYGDIDAENEDAFAGKQLYPAPSYWADDNVRAASFSEYDAGAKTIEIADAAQLGLFAYNLLADDDYYSGWTVTLTENIDLRGHLWKPVNMNNVIFDGNGKTVRGLRVNDYVEAKTSLYEAFSEEDEDNVPVSAAGLFGRLFKSQVLDLTLDKPTILLWDIDFSDDITLAGALAGIADSSELRRINIIEPRVEVSNFSSINTIAAGGVAGYLLGETRLNDATVQDGSLLCGADIWSYSYLGGVAGASYNSAIINCMSDLELTMEEQDLYMSFGSVLCIGGIAGYSSLDMAITYQACVLNSYSRSRINIKYYHTDPDPVSRELYAGGLVGFLEDSAINNYFIPSGSSGSWLTESGDGEGTEKHIGSLFGYVRNDADEYSISNNHYDSSAGDHIGYIDGTWTDNSTAIPGKNDLLNALQDGREAVADEFASYANFTKEIALSKTLYWNVEESKNGGWPILSTTPPSNNNGGNRVSRPVYDSEPVKTIEVTEVEASIFEGNEKLITAKANVENAFSSSVEVRLVDDSDARDLFHGLLGSDDEVYPFDISLYIKGTDTRTQPRDGYKVTLTLPLPEELWDMREAVQIACIDSGKVAVLESRIEQIDGVWCIIFETDHFSPYALVVGKIPDQPDSHLCNAFADIKTHWAFEDICYVVENRLFNGTSATTFSPDDPMTRGMIVTVLGRMAGVDPAEYAVPSFDDTPADAYYSPYVSWAAQNNIVTGYNEGIFGPDDKVTREQLAAILWRYAKYKDVDVSVGEDTNILSYNDAIDVSEYAIPAMQWACGEGIITGKPEALLDPAGEAARAEVAVMLHRFLELEK